MKALKHVHPPLGEMCCGLSCDLSCDLLYAIYCGDQKLSGSVGRSFDDITGFAELVCLKRSCEFWSDVNFVCHKGLPPSSLTSWQACFSAKQELCQWSASGFLGALCILVTCPRFNCYRFVLRNGESLDLLSKQSDAPLAMVRSTWASSSIAYSNECMHLNMCSYHGYHWRHTLAVPSAEKPWSKFVHILYIIQCFPHVCDVQ